MGLKIGPPYKYRGVREKKTVDNDLYLTLEGLHELRLMYYAEMREKRSQSYSAAPLCDLLAIADAEYHIKRINAKIDRLEGISDGLPF